MLSIPGHGTEVIVRLPLALGEEAPSAARGVAAQEVRGR